MAKKSSIYFGQPLEALTANVGENDSVSGRINRMADRYAAILKRHSIDLTDAEREILGNCLCGSFVEPLLIRHLADEVEDSDWADMPEAKSLCAKLRDASFADLVSIVESLGF